MDKNRTFTKIKIQTHNSLNTEVLNRYFCNNEIKPQNLKIHFGCKQARKTKDTSGTADMPKYTTV